MEIREVVSSAQISKKEDVSSALMSRFFPPEYFEQIKLADKIFTCCSLEDFNALNVDMGSKMVQGIFDDACMSDKDAKHLTTERLKQIFNSLHPVKDEGLQFI